MTDYSNAYFTGYGVSTPEQGATYYSDYIVIRDIPSNNIISIFNTRRGLDVFDSLGLCAVKLTVHFPGVPYKNLCAAVCPVGDPQPIATWSI